MWQHVVLFAFLLFHNTCCVSFDVTNLVCTSYDANVVVFKDCIYKAMNRSYKYVTIRAKLQKPVNNCKISCAILKRANGYKPFLFNKTVDVCEFLNNRKRFPVFQLIYSLLVEYTNVNHSCPYENEIILEKLDLHQKTKQLLSVLPMPTGEFAIYTIWMVNGLQVATIRGYGRLY